MADTKGPEAQEKTGKKGTVYRATVPLRMGNGAIAYGPGAEVSAEALDTEFAKANGWADGVEKQ